MNSSGDSNFEKFRRERRQRRAQFGNAPATAAKPGAASEVEAYEARQMHETRLTRDVHDFLAEATKQAATIVEKVTQVAEAEAAQRLAREMQEFLQETLRRAARFMQIVNSGPRKTALEELEPHVSKLVGPALDEFRHEGTAQLADKHIGQDPFYEELEESAPGPVDEVSLEDMEPDVVEEPPETPGTSQPQDTTLRAGRGEAGEPIRNNLFGEIPVPIDGGAAPAQAAAPAAAKPAAPAETAAPPSGLLTEAMFRDPETLKTSLKALVKAGVVTPDAARDMYRNALQRPTV